MCSARSGLGHPMGWICLVSTGGSQWGNWACWGKWLLSFLWRAYRADLPYVTAQCVSAWCPVKEGSMGATGVNLLPIKGDKFGIRSLC